MSDDDKPYEVGYGKPPKHGQFQKGQSGNPRGRPKGSGKIEASQILLKILKERLVVREGGVERRVTRLEVAFRQLVNKAASGELKAITETVKVITALGLTTTDPGLVEGQDYGVLVVPKPLSAEEWDRVYGPTMIPGYKTEE